ncbi:hypothetical protein KR038_010815 [Drosophila bunnanda]|nr:hypothetical protein KR038_010815 [Drosophila bunnanda]
MGNLPAERLRALRPFAICGVDFCGPVYTTLKIRGRPPYKSYIALLVCFESKAGLSCLRRWRLVSSAKQMFWRRWSREYVLGIQIRGKWHHEQDNIEEGQLVIVAEDNLPPQQWLLGRIVATHAGEDGMVRVVDLRRSDGAIFRRAIHKLAPLPGC